MKTEKIWKCKIGGLCEELPHGSDIPMRDAIREAYKKLTGEEPEFIFSGWAAELTESEREVVERHK